MSEKVTVIALRDVAITKPEPIRLHKDELHQLPISWARHYSEMGDVRLYAPTAENKMELPIREIKVNKNAAKLAKKLEIDIAFVEGTGQGGRITKKDVEKYAKAVGL